MSDTLSQELLSANYVSFATYKRSGDAVWTPVWAAPQQRSLFVFSEATAGKAKRLRNFSRANVAPCTAWGKITGNRYAAEAFLLDGKDDKAEIELAYKALHKKYGLMMRATDMLSKLSGKYDKRVLIRIDVGEQLAADA
ncbi:MAG: PPOX class F420-dependent oxidoreductase [Pseudomonadales bacterium]